MLGEQAGVHICGYPWPLKICLDKYNNSKVVSCITDISMRLPTIHQKW